MIVVVQGGPASVTIPPLLDEDVELELLVPLLDADADAELLVPLDEAELLTLAAEDADEDEAPTE